MVFEQWTWRQQKKKTEVCVFHQNNSRACQVVLGSEKVSVLKKMKILGLIQNLIGTIKL